jgi:hypothetical protein
MNAISTPGSVACAFADSAEAIKAAAAIVANAVVCIDVLPD